MFQDLRYAIRQCRKSPGFTAVVVLTLALGLGANTAIFSIVNATFLRDLPYPQPDRLVQVFESSQRWEKQSVSYPNFRDWQQAQDAFTQLAIFRTDSAKLETTAGTERVTLGYVSADFFAALGVRAALGRELTPDDDREGAAPVAWLSHNLWLRTFAGSVDVIGRTVRLAGATVTIAGVLPESFHFHRQMDLVVPVAPYAEQTFLKIRNNHNGTEVIGRLKPGVSHEAANVQIVAIAARLAQDYPKDNTGISARLLPLHEQYTGSSRAKLLLLFGAVGLILLIACVNIANMLLARAGTREREMAIRTSIGATPGMLLRQLLTESVVLALAGGTLGLFFGAWGCEVARRLMPWELQNILGDSIGLDLRVLLFSGLLALLTGLGFGLLPAWLLARKAPGAALKQTRTFVRTRFGRLHLPDLLVVAQVGLALVLLVGAGLMIRSLWLLSKVPSGLAPERVLTLRISSPSMDEYRRDPLAYVAFHERIVEAVQALPGVESAAFGSSLPFTWNTSSSTVFALDKPVPSTETLPAANSHYVTPDYFRAMGIPLLRGQGFDGLEPPPPMPENVELSERAFIEIYRNFEVKCVVSEAMAALLWPGEDALGKRFQMGNPAMNLPRFHVVGIVGNTAQQGLESRPPPEFYATFRQFPMPMGYHLVVRARQDAAALLGSIRTALKTIAPQEAVFDVKVMSERIAERSSDRRFNTGVFAFFGAVALALSSIGIYGVLSSNVARRTREIGIRMALGAHRGDVLRHILGSGLLLVVIGTALGAIGAFAAAKVLQSQLFGLSATDSLTYLLAALPLLATAFIACLLPARRATKVDPIVALRAE